MSEFLDDLARSMAKPMPRSRVVRMFASAVVGVAVPMSLTTRAARAAPPRTVTADCGECDTCTGNTTLCCIGILGNDGKKRCVRACLNPGDICCPAPRVVGVCRGATHKCGPLGINDTPTCVCKGPTCKGDGACCPRPGRCVGGRCCPGIRTTFAPGTSRRGVACCPPGTAAVPGGIGLCCRKGRRHCCDEFDPRVQNEDLSSLGLARGRLCVNGSVRKA